MENDMKEGFARIKPVCDSLMVCPTPDNINCFLVEVMDLKKEVVQELQQYLLFPFLTHITASLTSANVNKSEMQRILVDGMKSVVGMVRINSFELCMKIEFALLQIVFDKTKPGMLADGSEELKLSIMECLTVTLLNTEVKHREMLVRTQVPLLAQAVFISVHIAKLYKSRALRLAAINCLLAHTGMHPLMTYNYRITNPSLEKVMVDMLASILPGVLSSLQDIAVSHDNPGHGIVVAALDATHRILCATMADRLAAAPATPTARDFAALVLSPKSNTEVSNQKLRDIMKRSPEWYTMAAEKLSLVTKSLGTLRTHEHFKVRRELAIMCSRILNECNLSMQPSMTVVLEVLIALSKDEYPEVSKYCKNAVDKYFDNPDLDDSKKNKMMDNLCDNFFTTLEYLPSVLNNINASRKLSALSLVHGYVSLLKGSAHGKRAWETLGDGAALQLCAALLEAARLDRSLTLLTTRPAGVTSAPPTSSPWCKFRHVEEPRCAGVVRATCSLLGGAPCAALLLDRLLHELQHQREPEAAFVINLMASAPDSSPDLIKRVLDAYLEEDMWYLPLEVNTSDPPLTEEDTLDVNVYNPRSWIKDSVPGLFEGATEVRYTDIGYQKPRPAPTRQPGACATLAEAQRNMTLACILTEGVGMLARRLGHDFHPYMMRTICLMLERVGSPYEMLHLAGLKAVNDYAIGCGHADVKQLIGENADYCTHQVTVKLKKAWNCESALQILSVVMEYSDPSIQDYLYGIVQDVLVQSCDKYYEKNLNSYLQVFLTFIECIRKWYHIETPREDKPSPEERIDLLRDVVEYEKAAEEEKRLLNEIAEESSSKSPEEMYKEDLSSREENALDYDDTVTKEKPPLPQHVAVTIAILRRCLHFVSSSSRDNTLLSLQVLERALAVLAPHEDHLLPLVHEAWAPLVTRFELSEPPVLKKALQLLVTMAELSKDFIHARTVKEVLPHMYKYLNKSSKDSRLKDAGSWYRTTAAYSLQVAALETLPRLAVDLALQDDTLEDAMLCVDVYLSDKQPKPLQALAVKFFTKLLDYDYSAVWHHLRKLCDNKEVLKAPSVKHLKLQDIVGTPYTPTNEEYSRNMKKIFDKMAN
ncbi:hypothetical protein O3G_MSEX003662 [Manduca sexta]|uniref:TELO2-interacting protein 1 homolog n=1 Tax=Manduca sexta TaxID=7130 RepID=A0A921YT32_MANSE|nr:hypothetical protein O3G_MSEX003662 [Manduca sexta]